MTQCSCFQKALSGNVSEGILFSTVEIEMFSYKSEVRFLDLFEVSKLANKLNSRFRLGEAI